MEKRRRLNLLIEGVAEISLGSLGLIRPQLMLPEPC